MSDSCPIAQSFTRVSKSEVLAKVESQINTIREIRARYEAEARDIKASIIEKERIRTVWWKFGKRRWNETNMPADETLFRHWVSRGDGSIWRWDDPWHRASGCAKWYGHEELVDLKKLRRVAETGPDPDMYLSDLATATLHASFAFGDYRSR